MERKNVLRFLRAYADFLNTWGVTDAGACGCCDGYNVAANLSVVDEGQDKISLMNLNADEHWVWCDPEFIIPRVRGAKWRALEAAVNDRGLTIGGSSYWLWVSDPKGSMTGHVASVSLVPRMETECAAELLTLRLLEAWPEAEPR